MTSARTSTRRAAGAVGSLLGVGAAAALLVASGRTLPLPGTFSPSGLSRWATQAGPATATFTAARALAMLGMGWLAATWVIALVLRLLRLPRAVRAADGFTLPFVRRLAEVVAGATVVAVSLVPATHAGAATPATGPAVVMRDLGPSATTALPSPTSTTTVAPPPPVSTADAGPAAAPTGTDPSTGRSGSTWTVGPGDTLWHLAELTASDRLGRPASGGEVLDELDRLVALNADRLAVPGDADLIFPGQEFLIP